MAENFLSPQSVRRIKNRFPYMSDLDFWPSCVAIHDKVPKSVFHLRHCATKRDVKKLDFDNGKCMHQLRLMI